MLVDLDQLEPLLCCPRTRVPLVRDGAALRALTTTAAATLQSRAPRS
jgi:hypothetical protein